MIDKRGELLPEDGGVLCAEVDLIVRAIERFLHQRSSSQRAAGRRMGRIPDCPRRPLRRDRRRQARIRRRHHDPWRGCVARALARAALIDEYRLVILPVALGNGLPLFKDLATPLRVDLGEAKTFPDGTVIHVYQPTRTAR